MRGLPGLRMDAVQIHRDASTSDAEGNHVSSFSLIYDGRGTFTEKAASERTEGEAGSSAGRPFSQRRGKLELRCSAAILAGDRVTVMGTTWTVLEVGASRTHSVLRLVSPTVAGV